MVKFRIQSGKAGPLYDFGWHLVQACKHQNWYNGNEDLQYLLTPRAIAFDNKLVRQIPVGSVEWVHEFMEYTNIGIPKPINIPQELMRNEFLYREVKLGNLHDVPYRGKSFVKSATKVKGFVGIMDPENCKLPDNLLKDDYFLISEVIDQIHSEWRGFVHNGELVDLRCYIGDFTIMPDISAIEKMMSAYEDAPVAYTIDVAVIKYDSGTFVDHRTALIECHHFYSCALYGFQNYRKLPTMFTQWWYQYLTKTKVLRNE